MRYRAAAVAGAFAYAAVWTLVRTFEAGLAVYVRHTSRSP